MSADVIELESDDADSLVELLLTWYGQQARDLPWRAADRTPWGVLVSEVMLQQTQVSRVAPLWRTWMQRWPSPADLARATLADVLRAWGRLGYPRRAVRLHACAVQIVERHGGQVPQSREELRGLPGIGEYTSAAVAVFAFGQRHEVLDTNVRRVLARVAMGEQFPANNLSTAERTLAQSLLPRDAATAATYSVALMELGALVCLANSPRCAQCPVQALCAWNRAGQPPDTNPRRAQPRFDGSDRQARGRIMAALRETSEPLAEPELLADQSNSSQARRALNSLIADGLVAEAEQGTYRLPR